MEPNFRPKHPCRCPKVAKLSDNQFIQESNLKMSAKFKETINHNKPLTVRNMEVQAPKQPRSPKPCRKINHKSDWSESEDGKDDQARNNPIDVQDPQPSTSYARDSAQLRYPNTYPKVLNLGRGRGKGKFPLGNWTGVVKGHGHRVINEDDQSQIPPIKQEPQKNLAIVAPTDRIVYTDRILIYDEEPAPTRPRPHLVNWSLVSLGNNPNRPTVDEITRK